MDKQNKPHQTSGEEVTPITPAEPPPVQLQARSPYRPSSRRKRQELVPDPPPAVERPATTMRFDGSPTTLGAALVKAGAAPDEAVLAWRAGGGGEPEIDLAIDAEDSEAEG